MSRSILQEAQDIVYKDAGGHDYGSFDQNMIDACGFATIMTGKQVTVDIAFAVLIGLKFAREKQVHRIDNMVDVCGYMAGWSDYKEKQAWADAKNNDPETYATEQQKREDGDTDRDNDGREERSSVGVPVGQLP